MKKTLFSGLWLLALPLPLCLSLPGRADHSGPDVRIPTPTAANQVVYSGSTAPFTWQPVTLPYGTNGSQMAVGGSVDTASRLSVNPTGAAESGVKVVMPSGATGYGYSLYSSTGVLVFSVAPNGTFSATGSGSNLNGILFGNNTINGAQAIGGGLNDFLNLAGTTSGGSSYQFACVNGNAYTQASGVLLLKQNQSYSGDLLNAQTSGSIAVSRLSVGGAAYDTGNITVASSATPAAPTITQGGTTGSTSYSYRISAVSGNGETLASTEVTTTTGNATLSATNYNKLTWTPTTGAETYNIYRGAAGAEAKLANTTGATFNFASCTYSDTGGAASGPLPAVNTTGYINAPSYQVSGTAGLTTNTQVTTPTGTETLHFTSGLLTSVTTP